MVLRNLMLVRVVLRCWFAFVELIASEETVDLNLARRARRAPHGYTRVPSYTGERNDDGSWRYATDTGWKLEPRTLRGCECSFCGRLNPRALAQPENYDDPHRDRLFV